MTQSKYYNPSTELLILVRLDRLALEKFKKTKKGYNDKRKMQVRGFSLDELESITPFNRVKRKYKTKGNARN